MKKQNFIAMTISMVLAGAALAEAPVRPSISDGRIRYVSYSPDDVVTVGVQMGVVTRITLEPEEKIQKVGLGFRSDCNGAGAEWCIRADQGENQIWIKPMPGATNNNIELATDKRHYSFAIKNIPQKSEELPVYRVIFQYKVPTPTMPSLAPVKLPFEGLTGPAAAAAATTGKDDLVQVIEDLPIMRNTNYTKEANAAAKDLAPELVFDDGRFTYFRFPENMTMPAIFAIGPDGEESVNFSIIGSGERVGDVMKVQRLARQFVLRSGSAVVSIFNESFDPRGVGATSGVTFGTEKRIIK